MPTKPVDETAANQHVEPFLGIGLEEKTARNTIVNNTVTNNLLAVIHEAGVVDGCDRTIGNLLYTVATKFPANALVYRLKLLEYIMALKIKSPAQLDAAFSFFLSVDSEEFSVVEFEEACSVGIEISCEEIEKTVNDIFEEHKSLILEKRYRTNGSRGVTPTAINAFVRGIGITRSDCSTVRQDCLEHLIREVLNKTAPRTMVVMHPLRVVITNLEPGTVIDVNAKRWPDAPSDDPQAFYKVPFSKVVYIERSDFRLEDSKDYYGLAPGKSVLLKYAFPIKCTDVIFGDDKETVTGIRAEYDSEKKKHKGVLHWVAEPSPGVDPLKVEVRLFDKLFLSENSADLRDDWLHDLNPHSKTVIPDPYGVPSLRKATVGNSFQFERLGFFVVDNDSTSDKLVFNQTVTLRDSYGGKASN